MKARINVILDEKSDVYTVPYESIVQNGDTNSVYVAEKTGQKENEYVIKEIPITTGLESDLDVEILGDGLSEGIFIISEPSMYQVGQIVEINGR